MDIILNIFLFPFTLLEWVFSIIVWVWLFSAITQTDWYWDLSEKLKELYKKRWKNT